MLKKSIGITLALIIMSSFMLSSCVKKSKERNAEEMARKTVKETTGEDVDVKMRDDKIKIEGENFSSEMAVTTTWPEDMFSDVPKFTLAKIERVLKSDDGGMKKFNIFYVDLEIDALKKYADLLKKGGWQAQVMQAGDKGAMLNAQKGKLAMNFPLNLKEKNGTLVVYSLPE